MVAHSCCLLGGACRKYNDSTHTAQQADQTTRQRDGSGSVNQSINQLHVGGFIAIARQWQWNRACTDASARLLACDMHTCPTYVGDVRSFCVVFPLPRSAFCNVLAVCLCSWLCLFHPLLQNWTHPPFDGTVADGYIWGRGAMDVKVSKWLTESLLVHAECRRRYG